MNLSRYRPTKNLHKRIWIWLIFLSALIITDEYVKEGYIFDFSDVKIPFTHEFMLIFLWTAMTLVYLVLRIKKKGD